MSRSITILLGSALVLLTAGVVWFQLTGPTSGRVAIISTSTAGEHRLDGRVVSLTELEARLMALKTDKAPFTVAIAGPSPEIGAAKPSPEVMALLARLGLDWMPAPTVGLAVPPPASSQSDGGEHGQ